jgi:hypothetical protein
MRAIKTFGIAIVVRVRGFSRPDALAVLVVRVWLCEELRWRCRRARSTGIEDHKLRIGVHIHGGEFECIQPARLARNARAVLIALARANDEKLADIDSEILLSATPAILMRERRRCGLRTPAEPVPSTGSSDARYAKCRKVRRWPSAVVGTVDHRTVDVSAVALPIAEPVDLVIPCCVLVDRDRGIESVQVCVVEAKRVTRDRLSA